MLSPIVVQEHDLPGIVGEAEEIPELLATDIPSPSAQLLGDHFLDAGDLTHGREHARMFLHHLGDVGRRIAEGLVHRFRIGEELR